MPDHPPEIQLRAADRAVLKELKREQEVRDAAVAEGIVEDSDDILSYEELLLLIIPDDDDPLSWDMVKIHAREDGVRKRINRLAGDRVAAHDVVHHYLTEYMKQ